MAGFRASGSPADSRWRCWRRSSSAPRSRPWRSTRSGRSAISPPRLDARPSSGGCQLERPLAVLEVGRRRLREFPRTRRRRRELGGLLGPAFDASSVCAQSAFAAHAECRRARCSRHRPAARLHRGHLRRGPATASSEETGGPPCSCPRGSGRSGRRHRLDLAAPGGDLARAGLRRAAGRHRGASTPREAGPVGVGRSSGLPGSRSRRARWFSSATSS